MQLPRWLTRPRHRWVLMVTPQWVQSDAPRWALDCGTGRKLLRMVRRHSMEPSTGESTCASSRMRSSPNVGPASIDGSTAAPVPASMSTSSLSSPASGSVSDLAADALCRVDRAALALRLWWEPEPVRGLRRGDLGAGRPVSSRRPPVQLATSGGSGWRGTTLHRALHGTRSGAAAPAPPPGALGHTRRCSRKDIRPGVRTTRRPQNRHADPSPTPTAAPAPAPTAGGAADTAGDGADTAVGPGTAGDGGGAAKESAGQAAAWASMAPASPRPTSCVHLWHTTLPTTSISNRPPALSDDTVGGGGGAPPLLAPGVPGRPLWWAEAGERCAPPSVEPAGAGCAPLLAGRPASGSQWPPVLAIVLAQQPLRPGSGGLAQGRVDKTPGAGAGRRTSDDQCSAR